LSSEDLPEEQGGRSGGKKKLKRMIIKGGRIQRETTSDQRGAGQCVKVEEGPRGRKKLGEN